MTWYYKLSLALWPVIVVLVGLRSPADAFTIVAGFLSGFTLRGAVERTIETGPEPGEG